MGKVVFNYSVLDDPLETQARDQGFSLGRQSGHLEDLRRALNMVELHLANESQATDMRVKLNRKVISALGPLDA